MINNRQKIKITAISSVHLYDDPRIFHRQAQSISKRFRLTIILCAPFNRKIINENLTIVGLPIWNKKFDRLRNILLIMKYLKYNKSDLYIIHDPELIFLIPLLKKTAKCQIIYDIHENYKEMIEDKEWIPKYLRKLISIGYVNLEKITFKYLDMIWYPVTDIGKNYLNYINIKKLLVPNVPDLTYFQKIDRKNITPKNQFIYIGTMVKDRGIIELIKAFSFFLEKRNNFVLSLVGSIKSESYRYQILKEISRLGLNDKITIYDKISYEKIPLMLAESKVGLLNFLPNLNNIHGMPNKLFEYLAMGLPVIASDFPNYRNIILKSNAGLCIDPASPDEIANAMEKIVRDDKYRIELGNNGRILVKQFYNWDLVGKEIIVAIEDLVNDF